MRKSLDDLDLRLNMSLTTKVKVAKFPFLNEKSYNKTVIDFNFGRHYTTISYLSVQQSKLSPRGAVDDPMALLHEAEGTQKGMKYLFYYPTQN